MSLLSSRDHQSTCPTRAFGISLSRLCSCREAQRPFCLTTRMCSTTTRFWRSYIGRNRLRVGSWRQQCGHGQVVSLIPRKKRSWRRLRAGIGRLMYVLFFSCMKFPNSQHLIDFCATICRTCRDAESTWRSACCSTRLEGALVGGEYCYACCALEEWIHSD